MTTIVTKRLTLGSFTPTKDDLLQIVKWLNDPDVVRYSEQRHRHHTIESQQTYLLDGPEIYRNISTSDAFIGTIAAHVDKNNSVANVGILIGEKKEWGKGYGTEAWQAFCNHLLGHGIRKIEAGCMSSNHGMIKVFDKTGMYYEGHRSGHFQNGESEIDLIMYGRFL